MKAYTYQQIMLTIITICFVYISWRIYIFTSPGYSINTKVIQSPVRQERGDEDAINIKIVR